MREVGLGGQGQKSSLVLISLAKAGNQSLVCLQSGPPSPVQHFSAFGSGP